MSTKWSQVEKTEKSAITEKKIRVAFLQPGEGQSSSYTGTIDSPQVISHLVIDLYPKLTNYLDTV